MDTHSQKIFSKIENKTLKFKIKGTLLSKLKSITFNAHGQFQGLLEGSKSLSCIQEQYVTLRGNHVRESRGGGLQGHNK